MGNVTSTHTASWGVRDVHTGITILEASAGNSVVLSFNLTKEPVMAPETNEVGSTIGQAVYDVHSTARCTMNIKAEVAVGLKEYAKNPAQFAVICTIDGITYYVQNLEEIESNTDYMKLSVALERFMYDITPWDASRKGA